MADLCRAHGMSSASFYKWRAKYGGMDASLTSRIKAIEDENRRLKRMYADLSIQADLLKEAFRGSLEQHWIAGKALCLDEPLIGCLDMPHTHRIVPPVGDVLHLAVATYGTSNEVRESKLTIRDHRQQTARLPSKA